MRDESVRSRVTVPAGRRCVVYVGRGSRQGRGGRIAASCAFRQGIRVISFNRCGEGRGPVRAERDEAIEWRTGPWRRRRDARRLTVFTAVKLRRVTARG